MPRGSNSRRAVISEENFLGLPRDLISGDLYPKSNFFFRTLNKLSSRSRVKVFLSIRSQATFFESAYTEALKHDHLGARTRRELAIRLSRKQPSWATFLRNAVRLAPNCEFIVWNYEALSTIHENVLSELSGLDVEDFDLSAKTPLNRTGGRSLIPIMENLGRKISSPDRNRIYSALSDGDQGQSSSFEMFTPEIRRALHQRYVYDLAELADCDEVRLLGA